MKLQIEIPDDIYPRCVAAFSSSYERDTRLSEKPDSLMVRKISEHIEQITRASEVDKAVDGIHSSETIKANTEIRFS